MNNRTLYVTLLVSSLVACGFTLGLYAWLGGNPWHRLSYGIFVSVVPALGAFILFKVTKLFLSWQRAATVYAVLFILVLVIHIFGRMIPVYN